MRRVEKPRPRRTEARHRATTCEKPPPANEAALLEMARHATASQLERVCRGYRRVLASEAVEQPEHLSDEERRRFVLVRDTDDGMVRIEARLHPDEAAIVLQALDVARRQAWKRADAEDRADAAPTATSNGLDVSAETRTTADVEGAARRPHPALSRADALVAVAEAYLSVIASAGASADAGAAPIELVVHVDAAALRTGTHPHDHRDEFDSDDDARRHDPTRHHATLANGTALALATAQRLACDAAIVTVTTHQAPTPLPHAAPLAVAPTTVGRRTRRISATLRRALRVRDGGCRFPGCTNRLTDAHHVVAWARGGATRLGNLCSLCRRHHRLVHEHGYRIVADTSGTLRFLRRDGSVVPLADEDRPARRDHDIDDRDGERALGRASDALAPLRADAEQSGIVIDARTAFPLWDGEPPDYGLAVQALLAHDARTHPGFATNPCLPCRSKPAPS